MKHSILLGCLLAGVLFSSCKKNYKCVCTATAGNTEYIINDVKKKDAAASCDTYTQQWSSTFGGDCVLQEAPTP